MFLKLLIIVILKDIQYYSSKLNINMKLNKLKLNQLSDADLNEREMLRILGGGTPGCCQCGCNYAGESGGSSNQ